MLRGSIYTQASLTPDEAACYKYGNFLCDIYMHWNAVLYGFPVSGNNSTADVTVLHTLDVI